MKEGATLLNALLGSAITFLTGNFLPFAPVLGGAIAGYLEGGTRRDGMRVGAYSGLIAFVPLLALATVVSSVFGIVGIGFGVFGGVPGLGAVGVIGILFVAFLVLMAFVYLVGGGAVGGWLGNYVKYETDVDL